MSFHDGDIARLQTALDNDDGDIIISYRYYGTIN